MHILMIFLIGVVGPIGIYWQRKLYIADSAEFYSLSSFFSVLFKDPKFAFQEHLQIRLWVPFILGTIMIMGTIIWAIIATFDSQTDYTGEIIFGNLGKVTILFFAFHIKSYFGPIITCFISCVAIYNYFSYGEIQTIAIIQPMVDWVFGYFPDWIKFVYWIVLILNSLAGSIIDLLDN